MLKQKSSSVLQTHVLTLICLINVLQFMLVLRNFPCLHIFHLQNEKQNEKQNVLTPRFFTLVIEYINDKTNSSFICAIIRQIRVHSAQRCVFSVSFPVDLLLWQ